MMNEFILDWPSYRFLPYERRLALREVEALIGSEPRVTSAGVTVSAEEPSEPLLERLTYFHRVRFNGSGIVVPLQAQLEASGSTKPGFLFKEMQDAPTLRRQSTRYSAHGLHEYKGKFNPQIVRAAANLLGLGLSGRTPRVLDPFCGSGTCLVEAAHMGWDAVGVDANPLAIFISSAKIQALKVPVSTLQSCSRELVERLLPHVQRVNCNEAFSGTTFRRLASNTDTVLPNEAYLQKWFTSSVLAQLRLITSEIGHLQSGAVRQIALVILSDVLRPVSLQDPADLRIRRRAEPKPNYPVVQLFVNLFEQKVRTLIRARDVLGRVRGTQRALLGDSRQRIPESVRESGLQFDAVITSPPYATALPYIDTQRLSLALLGLLKPDQLRVAENQLIGNREISNKDRGAEERAISQSASDLPGEVVELCRKARELASEAGNGFRRRNVPALLLRYFRDMRDVFKAVRTKVLPQAHFAMVVGPNRTTPSGETLIIDTPRLLGQVAETAGWKVEETIPLDAYQRFDLHRQNSIRTEDMVVLKRR